jgi:hypothetical protein
LSHDAPSTVKARPVKKASQNGYSVFQDIAFRKKLQGAEALGVGKANFAA